MGEGTSLKRAVETIPEEGSTLPFSGCPEGVEEIIRRGRALKGGA